MKPFKPVPKSFQVLIMAQQSIPPPSSNPVFVIGSQFISPNPLELIIVRSSSGDHLITDVNDKIMFKVKRRNKSYHDQRLLLDADDIPIVTIREKILTAHSGWKAFKGDSKADSKMIFSTKTSKMIQSKMNLHVLLANKTSRSNDSCDFKIIGSWSKRSCSVYMGESSTIIAQMHKMKASENVKDRFMVEVHPYVDYAFVVTLMVIVDALKSTNANNDDSDEDIGDAGESTGDHVGDQSSGRVDETVEVVGESIGVLGEVLGTMFS
ncbi:hypothetical protein QVD17_06292 [Tagetes erecta]|uniref:Uncharacterized protein n=1 Tax=Tagetes erecta TaxID=13708 RepID=A0AAD8LDH4_TARER|nr:hypothetical protein QVD17_06292 [Tagetes erecta]